MMGSRFGWRIAAKLAWRDARASSARFFFMILAVAVGVGALTGVRSFSQAFRDMLLRNARTLMAADLSVRIFGLPSPEQLALLRKLGQHGVQQTEIIETLTMATSDEVRQPLLVTIKAVNPAFYPFYGAVKLDPPHPLRHSLDSGSVAVSDDLLIRLKTKVGETLRLGGQDFRIAAILVSEPDRMTGTLNVGPRVMLTRSGLDRTGLIQVGSRAAERFLFRLPPRGPGVEQVRLLLKKAFPEATIADYRQTHPVITRGLDRSTTFLSLVSLVALIVGSLGVATAIHAHLQQKMDHIAILKCLGARSGQVVRIYVAQILMLGLAGSLLGLLVGVGVQRAFPALIARFFQLRPGVNWDLAPAAQGLGIGILTALLFALPPLLGIRGVRPAIIFRREMAEARPDWTARWRKSRASVLSAGVILAGVGAIAVWLAGDTSHHAVRNASYFVGSLIVAVTVMAAIAWLMLKGLRLFLRGSRYKLPVVLRHGLANLYRPGNQTRAVLVALGVGVSFTLSIFLIQGSLLVQLVNSAPPGMPNVFLLDIPGPERQAVAELVTRQPGVQAAPEVMASVAAKLVSIDGAPLSPRQLHDWGRRFLRTRPVTWAAVKPPETDILSGSWWTPEKSPGPVAQVCVADDAARILGLKPGMRLEWEIAGRQLHSRVACIQRTESIRMAARYEFIFNPGSLDGLPAVYYGSVRALPANVPALQQTVYDRYPTITVVNVADVLQIVQQVVDQIAIVIRFLSALTILAGVIILASSVVGTRFRRIREVAILKTLGATRARVAAIFSVEFAVLGTVAGLIGSVLATGISSLLLQRLLDAQLRFDLWPNVVAVLLTAFLTVVVGWAASHRVLDQKPLEVLRDE